MYKGKTRKQMFATLVNALTGLCLKTYGSLADSKWKVIFCGMTEEYFLHNGITKNTNSVNYTIIHVDQGQGCLSCQ